MQGRTDLPLTERGRLQARTLAAWVRRLGLAFDVTYASPLLRAWETAEILSEGGGVPTPVAEPLLAEIHAGSLEGVTFTDIAERFPTYMARGVGGIGDFEEFGGESYDEVQGRA